MLNLNYSLRLLLLLLLLATGLTPALSAQTATTGFSDIRPKENNPLSRFGLGDPLQQYRAAQRGMGGLSATYQDAYHINIVNPASLASLQATSFEVGLYGRGNQLSDSNSEVTTYQGNLSYLSLAFPLRNPINLSLDRQLTSWNGGMAFSLAPTSLVGYDLVLRSPVDQNPNRVTSNQLRGDGGTYRFSWSTGLRYGGLSGGVNVDYNFGKITNSRLVVFDSIPEALGTEFLEDYSVGGFSFGYGVQYAYSFKDVDERGEQVANGKRIIVGAFGDIGSNIESESSSVFRRFSPNGVLLIPDTLASESESLGVVTLPASFTLGVAFEDANRLYVGVEYGTTSASAFRNDADPFQLQDARSFAAGVQYIPNASSYNNYRTRIRYRLGIRLAEDPRSVDGMQARRNAITLGFGLPIRLPRQQVSFFDIALEFGKFGVPDVIDQNYAQLTLGFSLNDNTWFFKRKLN